MFIFMCFRTLDEREEDEWRLDESLAQIPFKQTFLLRHFAENSLVFGYFHFEWNQNTNKFAEHSKGAPVIKFTFFLSLWWNSFYVKDCCWDFSKMWMDSALGCTTKTINAVQKSWRQICQNLLNKNKKNSICIAPYHYK